MLMLLQHISQEKIISASQCDHSTFKFIPTHIFSSHRSPEPLALSQLHGSLVDFCCPRTLVFVIGYQGGPCHSSGFLLSFCSHGVFQARVPHMVL